MKIAILGWGSLVWEKRPDFDKWCKDWKCDGPELPLEFSRISETRKGALTLVIDKKNGAQCRVAYTMSKRKRPEDAICDLRNREGTVLRHIGYYFAGDSRSGDPATPEVIKTWLKGKKFDMTVWTGLPSNFEEIRKIAFSLPEALSYLQDLSPEGKAKAAEYIWRAPEFIRTPLRQALQVEPWFNSACGNESEQR